MPLNHQFTMDSSSNDIQDPIIVGIAYCSGLVSASVEFMLGKRNRNGRLKLCCYEVHYPAGYKEKSRQPFMAAVLNQGTEYSAGRATFQTGTLRPQRAQWEMDEVTEILLGWLFEDHTLSRGAWAPFELKVPKY